MIVKIHSGADAFLPKMSNDAWTKIGELIDSIKEGRHLLIAERRVLDFLSNSDRLSEVQRGIAKRLRKKVAFFGAFHSLAPAAELFHGGKEVLRLHNGGEIRLPEFNFFDRACLVAENGLDCEIYEHFAKLYQLKSSLARCNVELELHNGGGTGTLDEATRQARRKKIGICIKDSDVFSQLERDRLQHRFSQQVIESTDNRFSGLIIDAHEIENILPLSILICALDSDDRYRTIERLEGECGSVSLELFRFCDFKAGTSIKHFVNSALPKTHNSDGSFEKLAAFSEGCDCQQCIDSEKCISDSCNRSVVKSIGTRVSQAYFDFVKGRSPKQCADSVTKQEPCLIPGCEVFRFGCAAVPTRL